MVKKYLLPLLAAAASGVGAAELSMPAIYSDAMIFQRGKPAVVRGMADPGAAVLVELGAASGSARADAAGVWRLELPAREASAEGVTLKVTSGDRRLEFSDVVFGDVWLCSGQSNMEFGLWQSAGGEVAAAASDDPQLRLFNVPKLRSPDGPDRDLPSGRWEPSSPRASAGFSAVGYFFAAKLRQDLGIPIGAINSSWGGTNIESWLAFEVLTAVQGDGVAKMMQLARDSRTPDMAETTTLFQAWLDTIHAAYAGEIAAARGWNLPACDDGGWEVMRGVSPVERYYPEFDGAFWMRQRLDIPEEWRGRDLTLNLGVIDDCDTTWFDGVEIGRTGIDTPSYWAAERHYLIPASLTDGAAGHVIAIRVEDHAFSGGFMSPGTALTIHPADRPEEAMLLNPDWRFRLEYTIDYQVQPWRPSPPTSVEDANFPTTLYNGMIAPWTDFPIRGVIWYQGENNVGQPAHYRTLMKALIESWRETWGDPELGFHLVQLAPFNPNLPRPLPEGFWEGFDWGGRSPWADMRAVQAEMTALPGVGMACTLDVGDAWDIHPIEKRAVGERLALEAERLTYGMDVVASGPREPAVTVDGDTLLVSFAEAGEGLTVKDGRPVFGFALAGADGVFHHPEVRIDGDRLMIRSPAVAVPKELRYAWAEFPGPVNLVNAAGLPAEPFRWRSEP